MNYIFHHIEYLIRQHDCVIVPGFGAFLAEDVPARIDMDGERILPPYRSVTFNRSVTVDDGLLVNSISRKEGVTFDEARQLVTKLVATISATLRDGGIVKSGNLGTISHGDDDTIVFSPLMTELSEQATNGYESASMAREDNNSSISEVVEETEAVSSGVVSDDYDKYYHIRVNKIFVKVAASLILVVGVALAFVLNPMPRDSRESRASVVPIPTSVSENVDEKDVESTDNEIENTESDTIDKSIVNSGEIEKPVSAETDIDNLHNFLIVATFSSPEEADKYVEKFSTDEYPLTIVSSKRLTRVSIFASNDFEEVRKKLNSSDIASRFPGAWIWKR